MKTLALLAVILFIARPSSAQTVDSLDLKIGQMIMIGIDERTTLSSGDPLVAELQRGRVGGVVLFEKNLAKKSTAENLTRLITALKAASTLPLWVSIDEEGGKVHRLKAQYGFFSVPSASRLGRLNNIDTTLHHHRKLAALLAGLGINLNYAPSVDMAVNPANTVIVRADRSFGRSAATVAKHAALCIRAHHENGVRTVLKHFPGHGSSNADSHLGLVDVTKTWQEQELLPYDTLIKAGLCDAVMMAHVVDRRWGSDTPATLSKGVATGLLRQKLGFRGVIFSDDMQMDAISDYYGFENAIQYAVNAGVDVLMFANTLPSAYKRVTPAQVHTVIKKLVQNGRIPRKRIDESYARIMELKQRSF